MIAKTNFFSYPLIVFVFAVKGSLSLVVRILKNIIMTNPFEQYQPPKKQENNDLDKVEQLRKQAMERLAGHSFKTEHGSVYTYDNQGRTSRFKAKTGEKFEPQDLTVFTDLSEEESREFLDAIHAKNPDLKRKIYIVEKQKNGEPRVVRKFSEVVDPQNLYLAMIKDSKMLKSKKATLKPTLNYTTFDTHHFYDGKEWKTERHLGHKVIEIN